MVTSVAPETARRLRLGVYTDLVFRRTADDVFSTDRSFIVFLTELVSRLEELVLFGRLDPVMGRSPHELPQERIRVVALPYYPRVTSIGRLAGSLARARAAFAAVLDHLDAVWLFGPHPFALEFARIARRRGVPVFLGVRQDFPAYIRGRLPGPAWSWAIPAAHALEQAFRQLARTAPTVVVGDGLGAAYGRAGGPLLTTSVSLVRDTDLAVTARRSSRFLGGRASPSERRTAGTREEPLAPTGDPVPAEAALSRLADDGSGLRPACNGSRGSRPGARRRRQLRAGGICPLRAISMGEVPRKPRPPPRLVDGGASAGAARGRGRRASDRRNRRRRGSHGTRRRRARSAHPPSRCGGGGRCPRTAPNGCGTT